MKPPKQEPRQTILLPAYEEAGLHSYYITKVCTMDVVPLDVERDSDLFHKLKCHPISRFKTSVYMFSPDEIILRKHNNNDHVFDVAFAFDYNNLDYGIAETGKREFLEPQKDEKAVQKWLDDIKQFGVVLREFDWKCPDLTFKSRPRSFFKKKKNIMR